MMFADIATGDTATGDILFLIAAIVFFLAGLASVRLPDRGSPAARLWWAPVLIPWGLCLVSIAWLLQ